MCSFPSCSIQTLLLELREMMKTLYMIKFDICFLSSLLGPCVVLEVLI